ncbi:MAG: hypothetical protein M1825_002936 [Sarcosagium campestre]|nr:MAG: hypothetical protein M1825_002936 [Sarcosagium campestre]
MARLNEPDLYEESVEAVKRRYLRQNRDIARDNTAKTIRIRALESEGTRLLTENLELREQISRLQAEVDKNAAFADIEKVKRKIQAKVSEFSGLVAELSHLQQSKRQEKMSSQPQLRTPNRKMTERARKSTLSPPQFRLALESTLETIGEGRTFPKHSPSTDRSRCMLPRRSQSFGIIESNAPKTSPFRPPGSPYSPTNKQSPPKSSPIVSIQSRNPPLRLSEQLEIRSKRRNSANFSEMQRESITEPQSPSVGTGLDLEDRIETKQYLKVAAKRKFGNVSGNNHADSQPSTATEDLKIQSLDIKRDVFALDENDIAPPRASEEVTKKPITNSRKISSDQHEGQEQSDMHKALDTKGSLEDRINSVTNMVEDLSLPGSEACLQKRSLIEEDGGISLISQRSKVVGNVRGKRAAAEMERLTSTATENPKRPRATEDHRSKKLDGSMAQTNLQDRKAKESAASRRPLGEKPQVNVKERIDTRIAGAVVDGKPQTDKTCGDERPASQKQLPVKSDSTPRISKAEKAPLAKKPIRLRRINSTEDHETAKTKAALVGEPDYDGDCERGVGAAPGPGSSRGGPATPAGRDRVLPTSEPRLRGAAESRLSAASSSSSSSPSSSSFPDDVPETGARATRKRRTTVSYAEPNLRDKMRRSGKGKSDAVQSAV